MNAPVPPDSPASVPNPPVSSWPAPSGPVPLEGDALQVWSANLDQHAPELLLPLLASGERARADRFQFEWDRRRFVVCRGLLRQLLGFQAGVAPSALGLAYATKGKPFLPGSPIHFNLAHAGALALFAFARHRPLGVDVEEVRPLPDLEEIARRFFSPDETRQVLECSGEERVRAFFRCWTRKEAFLKASGEGITAPLKAFTVTAGPDQPAAVLSILGNRDDAARWRLLHLEPALGFCGALAMRGPPSPDTTCGHLEPGWFD